MNRTEPGVLSCGRPWDGGMFIHFPNDLHILPWQKTGKECKSEMCLVTRVDSAKLHFLIGCFILQTVPLPRLSQTHNFQLNGVGTYIPISIKSWNIAPQSPALARRVWRFPWCPGLFPVLRLSGLLVECDSLKWFRKT